MSIRLRLALLYAITVGLLVVAMCAVTYGIVRSNLRSTAHGDAARLARSAASIEDPGELSLDRIAGPGVRVWLTDGSGAVVAQNHAAGPHVGTLAAVDRAIGAAPSGSSAARSPRAGGGVAVVLLSNDTVESSLSTLLSVLIGVGIAAVLVSALAGAILARRALRPIERMRREVDEIPGDELDRRIAEGRPDELGRLAAAFNRLLARAQAATEQQQRFVADASHELRTPITALQGHARIVERAASRGDLDQARESAHVVDETSRRLAHTVSELLSLAGTSEQQERRPVRLDRVAAEACDDLRAAFPDRRVETAFDEAQVTGDAGRLGELARILIDNALKYSSAPEPVSVTVQGDGSRVILVVRDHGHGFTADERARAFDRFYRGGGARGVEGSGLGLAIAQSIAEQHGTVVRLEDADGGGTAAVVAFAAVAPG
jgi:signal transduction histidine kinase